ncbi:MAG: sulfate transporter CysZ [Gammaproteobacteria bacterium]|nr:sulfate transporter CysZ [Gammaproteobacteria bacterium]
MDISKGFIYLAKGARLLTHKELRLFVFLPLLVNVLLFGLGIGLVFIYVGGWVDASVAALPDWLAWSAWLLWLVLTLLLAMGVFWGFNIIANLIAAPFNGLLAEKTQMLLTGCPVDGGGWDDFLRLLPSALGREVSKLLYYLPRVIILFVVGFIPGMQLFMPWLWLAFAAWMMAIQYVDYPMDNNRISFANMKRRLRQRKLLHLSFGSGVSLLLLLPLINFFVMPIAVVGATILWVEEHQ